MRIWHRAPIHTRPIIIIIIIFIIIIICIFSYFQSLRLSSDGLSKTTSGQIINLMSNDVGKFDYVSFYLLLPGFTYEANSTKM